MQLSERLEQTTLCLVSILVQSRHDDQSPRRQSSKGHNTETRGQLICVEITGQLNSQGTNTRLERTGVFSSGKNNSAVNVLKRRKYTQIHTPPWYREGGADGTLP